MRGVVWDVCVAKLHNWLHVAMHAALSIPICCGPRAAMAPRAPKHSEAETTANLPANGDASFDSFLVYVDLAELRKAFEVWLPVHPVGWFSAVVCLAILVNGRCLVLVYLLCAVCAAVVADCMFCDVAVAAFRAKLVMCVVIGS